MARVHHDETHLDAAVHLAAFRLVAVHRDLAACRLDECRFDEEGRRLPLRGVLLQNVSQHGENAVGREASCAAGQLAVFRWVVRDIVFPSDGHSVPQVLVWDVLESAYHRLNAPSWALFLAKGVLGVLR